MKEAFKVITDVSKISLHSLRSGGASAAANAGIHDRLFKRHGRWSSKNAKDCYVKDNLVALLSVSHSLGIWEPSPAGSKGCGYRAGILPLSIRCEGVGVYSSYGYSVTSFILVSSPL